MQPINDNRDWIIIETMAIRSTLWLMLIVMFGVRCETKIKIDAKEMSENLKKNQSSSIGLSFFLTYGVEANNGSKEVYEVNRSDLACIRKNERTPISFNFYVYGVKQLSFSTATDSENYTRHEEGPVVTLRWKKDENEALCFLTGTWVPSNGEDGIEIYLNFLTTVTLRENFDLVLLEFIARENTMLSFMVIQSMYPQDEKYMPNQQTYEPTGSSSPSEEVIENKILSSIDQLLTNQRVLVGEIYCEINKNHGVKYNLEQKVITLKGDGDLDIAFLSNKQIQTQVAVAAITNFINGKPKNIIDTPWAKMTNNGKVVAFSLLNQNQRLLSEGTGRSGFSLNNPYLVI